MLSPKIKRNISRIIPFGLIWLISGLVFLIVEKAATGSSSSGHSSAGIEINLEIFIFSSLAITCVGLFVGTIELLYINKLFAKKSFSKKIIYKVIIYSCFLFLIILITYPIAASLELSTNIFDERVLKKLFKYLISIHNFSTGLQLSVTLAVSIFYAEISENIGHGILLNFFTGKYHRPTEEKRIFMFLDMKSSTTIAEQLGNIKYFELLKQYYADLSDAIIKHSGEIYQYVGDEIIVSWKYKNGLQNNNCLECFYAMKKDLEKRITKYTANYGIAPSFRAGFHLGKVTTGEIGALKKEIIFTGDVLNATSRIQGLCKTYNVDILISGDLIKKLKLKSEFEIISLGNNELRGKSENLELFTLMKVQS
jgi:adenylate cyclase